MNTKKKHPLMPLLAIPVTLLIDFLVLFVTAQLDTAVMTDPEQMPMFTMAATLILLLVTGLVIIISVIKTMQRVLRRRKEAGEAL